MCAIIHKLRVTYKKFNPVIINQINNVKIFINKYQ